jgi:hypothetical protein
MKGFSFPHGSKFTDKWTTDLNFKDNKTEDKFETISDDCKQIGVYPTNFKQVWENFNKFQQHEQILTISRSNLSQFRSICLNFKQFQTITDKF